MDATLCGLLIFFFSYLDFWYTTQLGRLMKAKTSAPARWFWWSEVALEVAVPHKLQDQQQPQFHNKRWQL